MTDNNYKDFIAGLRGASSASHRLAGELKQLKGNLRRRASGAA